MSSSQPSPPCYWLDKSIIIDNGEGEVDIDCICLGTGRFLRSVLVPIMVEYMNAKNNSKNASKKAVGPVLIQPRGTSMIEYMSNKQQEQEENNNTTFSCCYEIDTVLSNGTTQTNQVPISAVFSLSSPQGKHSLVEYLPQIMKNGYVSLRYVRYVRSWIFCLVFRKYLHCSLLNPSLPLSLSVFTI